MNGLYKDSPREQVVSRRRMFVQMVPSLSSPFIFDLEALFAALPGKKVDHRVRFSCEVFN